jgi:hypothetical protein
MNRGTLDKLISSTGLILAVVLLASSGALFWTYNFIHTQVHDQMAAEKIYFPDAGTKALTSLPGSDHDKVAQFAGQQLLTGAQAEVFADHFIAVHLKEIGSGKTYSELSTAALADPTNQKLAGQVQTVFRGETLRGLLLNAYAFDTMAVVAHYAALGALAAGVLLVALSLLGFRHAGVAARKRK